MRRLLAVGLLLSGCGSVKINAAIDAAATDGAATDAPPPDADLGAHLHRGQRWQGRHGLDRGDCTAIGPGTALPIFCVQQ